MVKHTSIQTTSVILIVILILAAGLRFFYLMQIQSNPLSVYVTKFEVFDQYRFMEPVREFMKGNWLGSQVSGRYSIAYSYLIAFLYTLFLPNINTLFVFQILLGLLSVYIFYRATSFLFYNKNIGLIAAFIAAVYSPFLFQECNMERGVIIAYTNLLGFYFLLRAVRKYKMQYFFLAGIVIGISMVMRGNALFLFIIAYILFTVKKAYRQKMLSVSIFLIGMILVILPLSIRNKIVSDTFLIEHQWIENFWVGNTYNSSGVEYWPLSSSDELSKECRNSVINTLKILMREIKEHPREYMNLYMRKIKMFFNAHEIPANISYDLYKENHSALRFGFITFGIICPLSLLGMCLVRRKYLSTGLLYLFLCVLSISNILFHIQGRYRIPAIPFFIIFSSYAIYWFTDMARKRKPLVFFTAFFIVMILYFYTKPDDSIIRYSSGSRIRGVDYGNLADAYFRKAMYASGSKARKDKMLQKAATNLVKLIKVNPNNLNAYLFLGDVYYKLGRYGDVKETYNQVLKLDPKNKIANEYMTKTQKEPVTFP